MSISIAFKTIGYTFCFGREGATFSQLFYFSISKEYYEDMSIVFGTLIFGK